MMLGASGDAWKVCISHDPDTMQLGPASTRDQYDRQDFTEYGDKFGSSTEKRRVTWQVR